MKKIRISVKELLSFNSMEGSIGGSILNSSRALIGANEHKRIQESRGQDYSKEYSLKTIIERSGLLVEVYGRADGIYIENDPPIIEEIKTTTSEDINQDHLSQAKLYAYMYMIENDLKGISLNHIKIELLYINILTKNERVLKQEINRKELTVFFESQIEPFLDYHLKNADWSDKRNNSLKILSFPFEVFRDGQREFSINVYRSIRDSETLFARAPTGTGKSIATIFPGLKAMAEGFCSKIFYLTAKTVGRITARETLNIIRSNGAEIRSVVITAKEKTCINSEFKCNPQDCLFAKDYYKKIRNVINEVLDFKDFYEDNLKEIGHKYSVCPFELSLDLSLECDIIICDYNYVFDLKVYLKRFFESGTNDYSLLIDEAHNLPDRLRSSYSCKIVREDIPPLINTMNSVSDLITNSLVEINDTLIEFITQNPNSETIIAIIPDNFIKLLRKFTILVETYILDKDFIGKTQVLDWYFNTLFFIKLSELYTDGHIWLQTNNGGLGISIEIVCNDPSYLFTKMLSRAKSHIFFSATLTPITYFENVLIKNKEFKYIDIGSPFPAENLNIVIRPDIKTTYKERGRSYQNIADIINTVIETKKGNYIVFFPSYSYMEEVEKLMKIPIHSQKYNMNEIMRKEYLDQFVGSRSLLSFAIMGGVFGEGIDLVGDNLIGVIVVGVGLPQLTIKNDQIKKSFNYDFAYTYPGFNRVMQAVGRVIRSEYDRGVAVLIDHRYSTSKYKNIFPNEWRGFSTCQNNIQLKYNLEHFWSG